MDHFVNPSPHVPMSGSIADIGKDISVAES